MCIIIHNYTKPNTIYIDIIALIKSKFTQMRNKGEL